MQTQTNSQLVQEINQVLASGFEIPAEKLVPTATLQGDLGLDSLDAVDMLVFIEDKFGIKVEGDKLRSMQTLGDVYLLASEATAKAQAQTAATIM